MKKASLILAAMVLVLGLSQCKKEEQPKVIEGEVAITLDVRANNGSKIDVNTSTGAVAFEYGDVVYVASGGKYVGTLTCGGSSFAGRISNPTLNEPLYFFFLGNKTPMETLEAGTATSCSVIISDQTEKLPVISFATSNETFTGAGNYTAYFLNKAALVKFDVTTPSSSPVCLVGMNNKVAVDFTNNGFAYSMEGEGRITLAAGNGERWAILLPQASMNSAVAHTLDNEYLGTCGHVPPIWANDYHTEGIEVNVSEFAHDRVDLGLPSGLLWATCNVGADNPEDYGDYFAWGETQTKDTYGWSTYQYCTGGNYEYPYYNMFTKYCNSSSFGYNGFTDNLTTLLPEDDAATANWGSVWRMPTSEEWQELLNNTTNTKTTQNGVSGRLFTAPNGNSLFLPAAGSRWNNELYSVGSDGYYWSSSLYTTDPYIAWDLSFDMATYSVCDLSYYDYRGNGYPVRPVRSVREN